MTREEVRRYTIYDHEPWKTLLDLPGLIIGLLIPIIIFLNIIAAESIGTAHIVFFVAFLTASVLICPALWSKYITSTKVNIIIDQDRMNISFPRSRRKKESIVLELSKINEIQTSHVGRDIHFKITYDNDKLIAFSKFTLYWIISDDFYKFKKDLEKIIE